MNHPTAASRVRACRSRQVRVWALVAVIVVLSGFDLSRTLHHQARSTMAEANPVARWIMSYESPGLLIGWKAASVMVAAGILLPLSRRVSAEVGAIVSAALLVALAVHWFRYDAEVSRLDRLAAAITTR